MKKIILSITLISLAVFFTSCSTPKVKRMYDLQEYNEMYQNYLLDGDEDSREELVEVFEEIIDLDRVPPGIFADYGFLLISMGKIEEGKKLLAAEIAAYPESQIFISNILKMMER